MRTVVPDASVLLAFYLPAERYKKSALAILRAFIEGELRLVIPALAYYEVLNGLVKGVRGLRTGERLPREEATAILRAFLGLRLDTAPVDGMEEEILDSAVRHDQSAYDAAYLVLAQRNGWEMVTGDERFFRSLSHRFPFIRRVEELAAEG